MEITYEMIAPLIVSTDVHGSQILCSFRTQSGEIIQSAASIRRMNDIQSQVTRRVKTIVVNRTRSKVASIVGRALGGGILGSTAASVIRTVSNPTSYGFQYSDEEKEYAIVEAFLKVSDYFNFNEQKGEWREAKITPTTKLENVSPIERQLHQSPLSSHFEKEVMARILVELAQVDGEIEPEEREILEDMIHPEIGTIQSLSLRDPVSPVECRELSTQARETILMAAWMVALSNMDLNPSEEGLLQEYGEMFALPAATVQRIVRDAQFSVLEQEIDLNTNRTTLYELADRLRMSHEDAELCLIQMKKRL